MSPLLLLRQPERTGSYPLLRGPGLWPARREDSCSRTPHLTVLLLSSLYPYAACSLDHSLFFSSSRKLSWKLLFYSSPENTTHFLLPASPVTSLLLEFHVFGTARLVRHNSCPDFRSPTPPPDIQVCQQSRGEELALQTHHAVFQKVLP